MWFVLQLYTSASEIPTISYTWSLKKITLSGGASSYWPSKGVPRPPGPIDRVCTARYRVLNFWKSLEIWPAIFQTWKKSGQVLEKSYKWIFFCFGHILFNLARMFAAHHEKSFVPAFFKVSIDQLFDNLESGKRNYCFGKMSWKSLEFWIKKSVPTLFTEHCHWSGNWSPN